MNEIENQKRKKKSRNLHTKRRRKPYFTYTWVIMTAMKALSSCVKGADMRYAKKDKIEGIKKEFWMLSKPENDEEKRESERPETLI